MTRTGASFAAAMAAGVLMGGFAESHAATITQTQPFSTAATDSTVIPATAPVAFNGFTLLGADLVQADLYLLAPSTVPLATSQANITGSEGGSSRLLASFSISEAALGTAFSLSNLDSGTATIVNNGGPAQADSKEAVATTSDFNASPVSYSGTDLSEFLTATVTFLASIDGFNPNTVTCSTSTNTCTHSAFFNGSLQIVYTYTTSTEVPEPASLAILATGFTGLMAAGRRQVARRSRRDRPRSK